MAGIGLLQLARDNAIGTALASDRARAYVEAMRRLSIFGIIALVAPVLAMLAAATWYAAGVMFSAAGPSMPATGYVAMGLGIVFSLVVGCGLMALLFYSSRHGYDEPHRVDDEGAPDR